MDKLTKYLTKTIINITDGHSKLSSLSRLSSVLVTSGAISFNVGGIQSLTKFKVILRVPCM